MSPLHDRFACPLLDISSRGAAVAALLLSALLLTVGFDPCPAAAGDSPYPNDYRPPVEAPVVDRFRPPPHIGAPGNRGFGYAPEPDTPVHAAKAGQVSFAGQVGGSLYVTVVHDDGLRTSYSYLNTIAVEAGQFVSSGDVIGLSGEAFHFGVRAGDTYLDPALILGGFRGRARLVSAQTVQDFTASQLPIVDSGLIEWARAPGRSPLPATSWPTPLRYVADLAVHFRSGSGPWLEPPPSR
jgi:hypothetical protein